MATSIAFTDGTGAATLTNGKPAPASRFANWTPDVMSVGDREVTLADGITHEVRLRTDYLASFELPLIPAATLDIALRLKLWLLAGNTCTVNTGDTSTRNYTARLAPGTVPEIVFANPHRLWYTLRLTVKNTSAAAMLCTY